MTAKTRVIAILAVTIIMAAFVAGTTAQAVEPGPKPNLAGSRDATATLPPLTNFRVAGSISTITASFDAQPTIDAAYMYYYSKSNTMGNFSVTTSRSGWLLAPPGTISSIEMTTHPGSFYYVSIRGYDATGCTPEATGSTVLTAPVTSRLAYVLPAVRLRGTLTVQIIATVPPDAWPASCGPNRTLVRRYHREWRYVNRRRVLVWVYKGYVLVWASVGNDFGKETRIKYFFRPRYVRDRGWWYFKPTVPPWREGFYDTTTGTSPRTFKTRAVKAI